MRAVRLEPTTIRIDHAAPAPQPEAGEALVRIRRVGISPIDVAAARGQVRLPATPGHEGVGTVEKINIPADAPAALRERLELRGKRAVIAPTISCGHCDMCRSGLSPHCRVRRVIGVHGHEGCMAEQVCVPVASLRLVPDGVDDDAAALAAPLATALQAAQVAGRYKGFVGVLGSGVVALLTALVAARRNPSARLLTTGPGAAEVCEKWGLKNRPADEAGRRQDQDVIIDATGAPAGLRLAMQFVRPRGVIVLAPPSPPPIYPPGVPFPEGSAASGPMFDLAPVVSGELTIAGSRDGSITEALALIQRAEIDVRPLISRRFRLDDAAAAFRAAAANESVKVLLEV